MKTSILILSGCLLAGVALGDVNYSIAKGQAKNAAGGQGNAPSGGAPGAPQPPPMNPELAATLKNIASLRADLTAVSAAADATAAGDQRIPLLNHLSAAAQGTKASTANVRKLAGDLITALAGHKKITEQSQKIAGAVHALFNGAHVSATQQETLLDELQKIFTAAEVPADDAAKVLDDLKAVAAETK
jgi:hypothetical protein